MAFTVSDLTAAQARLIAGFQKGEFRTPNNGTFLQYKRNAEIMTPTFNTLRTREDRVLNVYYINRAKRAVGTGRSHNHTGVSGTSGVLTPTWTTINDGFSQTLKQADKNVMEKAEMLASEILNVQMNLITDLEQKAVDHLFANRSGVNVATVEGSFNATKDAFEVTESTNGNRFAQIIDSVMMLNDWTGSKIYFCDTVAYNKFLFQAAQGAQNATNLSFQFLGNLYIHSYKLSVSAATLSYTKGFVVCVQDGLIAGLDSIPMQNRQGVVTRLQTYTSILNPLDGINYALHMYEQAANGTSVGGYTQDEITQFEVSLDVAFEKAPLSTANETPLQAFALV
jgi:hypothetical protein